MRLIYPTPALWAVTLLAAGFAGDAFLLCAAVGSIEAAIVRTRTRSDAVG